MDCVIKCCLCMCTKMPSTHGCSTVDPSALKIYDRWIVGSSQSGRHQSPACQNKVINLSVVEKVYQKSFLLFVIIFIFYLYIFCNM